VQDLLVVTPEMELDSLECGGNACDVVLLRDQAESQYENRISRIDSGQAVVAALVHEDKVAAELDLIWIAHPTCLSKTPI
jgi:hypothetical protein